MAFHVAGHAVAAYLLGRDYQYVTIGPNEAEGNLGHVRYSRGAALCPDEEDVDPNLELEILTSFAGGIAGEHGTGVPNPTGCGSDDRTSVDRALYRAGSAKQTEERLEQLRSQAAQLVDWAWAAIEALGAQLLTSRTLGAEQANQLVERHLPTERKGATAVLCCRVDRLEAELRELRQLIADSQRLLRLPVLLVDPQNAPVAELTTRGELVPRPSPPRRSPFETAG